MAIYCKLSTSADYKLITYHKKALLEAKTGFNMDDEGDLDTMFASICSNEGQRYHDPRRPRQTIPTAHTSYS